MDDFSERIRKWIAPQLAIRDEKLNYVSNPVSIETRLKFGQLPNAEIWEVRPRDVKAALREARHG